MLCDTLLKKSALSSINLLNPSYFIVNMFVLNKTPFSTFAEYLQTLIYHFVKSSLTNIFYYVLL